MEILMAHGCTIFFFSGNIFTTESLKVKLSRTDFNFSWSKHKDLIMTMRCFPWMKREHRRCKRKDKQLGKGWWQSLPRKICCTYTLRIKYGDSALIIRTFAFSGWNSRCYTLVCTAHIYSYSSPIHINLVNVIIIDRYTIALPTRLQIHMYFWSTQLQYKSKWKSFYKTPVSVDYLYFNNFCFSDSIPLWEVGVVLKKNI